MIWQLCCMAVKLANGEGTGDKDGTDLCSAVSKASHVSTISRNGQMPSGVGSVMHQVTHVLHLLR